jgi:hypothetical protein
MGDCRLVVPVGIVWKMIDSGFVMFSRISQEELSLIDDIKNKLLSTFYVFKIRNPPSNDL